MNGSDGASAIHELWWHKLSTPKFSASTVKLHGLTTTTLATKEKCRSLNRKERQVEERTEGRKDTWTNAEEFLHIIEKLASNRQAKVPRKGVKFRELKLDPCREFDEARLPEELAVS
jgi:hypothetical protein